VTKQIQKFQQQQQKNCFFFVCLCVYLVWQKDGRNIKDQIRNDGKHFPHFTYYYSGAKKKVFTNKKALRRHTSHTL
jgi:hypothetical protein